MDEILLLGLMERRMHCQNQCAGWCHVTVGHNPEYGGMVQDGWEVWFTRQPLVIIQNMEGWTSLGIMMLNLCF